MTDSLRKYGFRSARQFYRTSNIDAKMFEEMSNDYWWAAKHVLYHKECPISIRNKFAFNSLWYKRLVALFTKSAPKEYFDMAREDPDVRVRKAYVKTLEYRRLG